jgi:hypothetical protein
MGLIAKDNGGGGDFALAPAGNHVGRCVQLIDLGTLYSRYYDKWSHKVLLGWELPGEGNGDKGPHIVFKRFTLSLHENAQLRKDLESWRGRKFTRDELDGFDLRKVVGVPGLINVSHRESDGRTYADVDAVTPLPKGTDCPAQVHPLIQFDIDDPDMDVFNEFSDGLKDTIRSAKEWTAPTAGDPQPGEYDVPADSSIPF